MKNFSLISMSKVYESEVFYKPFVKSEDYIDCTDVQGDNCYADEDAIDKLRQRLGKVDVRRLHFIDSGNYHYISYLFLEKISEDFELILIDKHPDCKTPMFEELISCGGWIKEALINLEHLKRVYMIGVDTDLLYELDDLGKDRNKAIVVRSAHKLSESTLPVYLSVDKDVLSAEVVTTNWDQGNMSLEELDEWLLYIFDNRKVIGIDICGEADVFESSSIHNINDEINSHLLSIIHKKHFS